MHNKSLLEAQRAQQGPERQCPQPESIAQMAQEGVNLAFVDEGSGVAAVAESNALLPLPLPPTGPLQQHGCKRARLHPVQRHQTRSRGQRPLPLPLPHNIDWWGGSRQYLRTSLGLPQLTDSYF